MKEGARIPTSTSPSNDEVIEKCLAKVDILQQNLKKKDLKVDRTEEHTLSFGTGLQIQNKKRKLDMAPMRRL